MEWLNEPASWQRTGDVLTVSVDPGTDFWRETGYGYIRDSGHVYGEVLAGDLDVSVRIRCVLEAQYDQVGVMVRADEQTWLKTGIEFFEGRPRLSTVLTLGRSSWMVTDLPNGTDDIGLRVSRRGDAVEVRYQLGGGPAELAALVFMPPDADVLAGVMAAAPEGPGFRVTFQDLQITAADWSEPAEEWAGEPAWTAEEGSAGAWSGADGVSATEPAPAWDGPEAAPGWEGPEATPAWEAPDASVAWEGEEPASAWDTGQQEREQREREQPGWASGALSEDHPSWPAGDPAVPFPGEDDPDWPKKLGLADDPDWFTGAIEDDAPGPAGNPAQDDQPGDAPATDAPRDAPGAGAPRDALDMPATRDVHGADALREAPGTDAARDALGAGAPRDALGMPVPRDVSGTDVLRETPIMDALRDALGTDPLGDAPTGPGPAVPGEPTDGEPTDGEPTDGEPTDREPTGKEPTDGEPTDGEPTDSEPTDDEPTDKGPTDGELADKGPTDREPTGEEPTDKEPTNSNRQVWAPAPTLEDAVADWDRLAAGVQGGAGRAAPAERWTAQTDADVANEWPGPPLRAARRAVIDRGLAAGNEPGPAAGAPAAPASPATTEPAAASPAEPGPPPDTDPEGEPPGDQNGPGPAADGRKEPAHAKRRKAGAARPPADTPGPPDPADEWISLLTADPADE